MSFKPRFLVLEGLDASGKSTVAAALQTALQAQLLATPLPSLRDVRAIVDQAMASPLARMVWYAAHTVAASDQIRGFLAEGRHAVLDRYWLTTRVYSRMEGEAATLEEIAQALQPPDLTFLLCPSHDLRKQRLLARPGLQTHDAYSLTAEGETQMLQLYRSLARHPLAGRLIEIPVFATTSPQAIVDQILCILNEEA